MADTQDILEQLHNLMEGQPMTREQLEAREALYRQQREEALNEAEAAHQRLVEDAAERGILTGVTLTVPGGPRGDQTTDIAILQEMADTTRQVYPDHVAAGVANVLFHALERLLAVERELESRDRDGE